MARNFNRPDEVVAAIVRRKCVAFIGAGFTQPAGMPLWITLLTDVCAELRAGSLPSKTGMGRIALQVRISEVERAVSVGEFKYAASIIQSAVAKSVLSKYLAKRFSKPERLAPEIAQRMSARIRAVMELPCAGLITTNYDDYLDDEVGSVLPTLVSKDGQSGLGELFVDNIRSIGFYIKLHGDRLGRPILSSEDYDERYMRSGRVRTILEGAMLRYHFLFLGSSIEGELLRIRRGLMLSFDGAIPVAFALVADSEAGVVRAKWLESYANIRTVFYNNSDGSHLGFDEMLQKLSVQARSDYLSVTGLLPGSSVRRLVGLTHKEKMDGIGIVNRNLIYYVRDELCNDARHSDFESFECPEVAKSSPISHSEIMYRVFYLVSIGLLEERRSLSSLSYAATF